MFTFVINGTRIERVLVEAVLLSPAVQEELIADRSSREFFIDDDHVDVSTFSILPELYRFEEMLVREADVRSLIRICRYLKNGNIAQILFGLHCKASTSPLKLKLLEMTSFDPAQIAKDFYLFSVHEISVLDIDTLSHILLSDSLRIENEDWLLQMIIELGSDYSSLLNHLHFEFLSSSGILRFIETYDYHDLTEAIWSGLTLRLKGLCDENMKQRRFASKPTAQSAQQLDSKIISELPLVLNEFQGKSMKLLYRGSREGFQASNFHSKCDGIGNTLTFIESSKRSLFGGYTPSAWDSTTRDKYDTTLQSFLFTLKNPHNIPARKFSLISGRRAIYCASSDGPSFGGGTDIRVLDRCNAHNENYLNFGHSYQNNTGINGTTIFNGEYHFTVHEIEVFSISE
jgi:hypothetical protein